MPNLLATGLTELEVVAVAMAWEIKWKREKAAIARTKRERDALNSEVDGLANALMMLCNAGESCPLNVLNKRKGWEIEATIARLTSTKGNV